MQRASDPGRNEPATDAQRERRRVGRACAFLRRCAAARRAGAVAAMSRYRVSMDIGGTFTDVVAYDEEHGTYRRREVVDDAERPHGGRLRGARDGRSTRRPTSRSPCTARRRA